MCVFDHLLYLSVLRGPSGFRAVAGISAAFSGGVVRHQISCSQSWGPQKSVCAYCAEQQITHLK